MPPSKTHILKSALVYMLLLVYVTGLVRPLVPIVQDMVAHTFYKMEHMATVHFENGKYHVHTELQQEAKKSGPQKASYTGNESLSAHLKSEELLLTMYLQQLSGITSPCVDTYMDMLIPVPILPPRG